MSQVHKTGAHRGEEPTLGLDYEGRVFQMFRKTDKCAPEPSTLHPVHAKRPFCGGYSTSASQTQKHKSRTQNTTHQPQYLSARVCAAVGVGAWTCRRKRSARRSGARTCTTRRRASCMGRASTKRPSGSSSCRGGGWRTTRCCTKFHRSDVAIGGSITRSVMCNVQNERLLQIRTISKVCSVNPEDC